MITISACCFLNFNTLTGELRPSSEKTYSYYNLLQIPVGAYALVHNGRDFTMVKVVKHLTTPTELTNSKAAKPLLGIVDFSPEKYLEARRLIKGEPAT